MSSLQTTTRHIRRSPFHATGAILVLSFTFYLFSRFVLESAAIHQLFSHFASLPQAVAFFKDGTSDEEIASLKKSLEMTGKVKTIAIVSKQEALKIYQEQNKNDPLLLEMVTADILPTSLEVSAVAPDALTDLAQIMKNNQSVEDLSFNEDVTQRLNEWKESIQTTGLIRLGVFTVSAAVIVVMVISLKVANKKPEFEILKLLGATRSYIVAPFLLEGMFYGVVGALIGWGLAYLELLYSTPLLLDLFKDISLLPAPLWFMLSLLGSQAVLGLVVGLLASAFAARRFLKAG